MSNNTEIANYLEKPRRARIFLDINVEKSPQRLIRLSLHFLEFRVYGESKGDPSQMVSRKVIPARW